MQRIRILGGLATVVVGLMVGSAHHRPGHSVPPGQQATTTTTIAPATTTTAPTTTTAAPTTTSTTTGDPAASDPAGPIRITEDNTVIDGYHFTGDGPCVTVEDAANVTIRNSVFENCGVGVYALNSADVHVVDSTFTADEADRGRNAVQFDKVNGGTISGNVISVASGETKAEDHISVYQSSGTSTAPILVEANYISGGGPSQSGSGIMVGDQGGSWVMVRGNVLVNPGQVGIGIPGGSYLSIVDNQIYSTAAPWSNIGLYVWNQSSATCTGHRVEGNQVDWTNSSGSKNAAWNSGNCGTVTGWDNNDWDADLADLAASSPLSGPR